MLFSSDHHTYVEWYGENKHLIDVISMRNTNGQCPENMLIIPISAENMVAAIFCGRCRLVICSGCFARFPIKQISLDNQDYKRHFMDLMSLIQL